MEATEDPVDLIGRTPLLKLNGLFPGSPADIYAKLEFQNLMSVKDRPVLSMIRAGIEEGSIRSETEVVEASSGNTAIAIALLGAVMGFRVRIFMSELASVERRQIITAYGAKVVITPGSEHTKGARQRAIRYCEENPDTTYFLNQHSNPNNGLAHYRTTGPEIWEQTNGKIDIMIIGLGTSGTFDGLSTYFKEKDPSIRIICFEPESSPVYSGGEQGKHKLIGIGPGFQTENFLRSRKNMDELILVPDDEAYEMTRRIARKEGLLVGVTSGAAAWVAEKVAGRSENRGKTICCLFYDTGERYLTTPDLFPTDNVEYMD
ncbi:MAG: PLP-dependent cysteine synthase family protein [Thermoplasmatota archaeon]